MTVKWWESRRVVERNCIEKWRQNIYYNIEYDNNTKPIRAINLRRCKTQVPDLFMKQVRRLSVLSLEDDLEFAHWEIKLNIGQTSAQNLVELDKTLQKMSILLCISKSKPTIKPRKNILFSSDMGWLGWKLPWLECLYNLI